MGSVRVITYVHLSLAKAMMVLLSSRTSLLAKLFTQLDTVLGVLLIFLFLEHKQRIEKQTGHILYGES